MAVSPANLIIIQNNYSNLQTLTIELKMALIPNGGKLQTESAVQRALGCGREEGYKCSSGTSVNYWGRGKSHLGYKVCSRYKVRSSEVIRKLSLLKTEDEAAFYRGRELWIHSGDCRNHGR